jgi:DNA-binding response OmpR family regulator
MTFADRASIIRGVRLVGGGCSGVHEAKWSEQPLLVGEGRAHVLIADRNRELVELIACVLDRAGLRYATAYDEASAMERFASVRPAVVVVDPNGLDVLWQLRAGSHEAAIIILTTGDSEEQRASALEQGADDYVTKPFSPRDLLARIRLRLRRSQPNSLWGASPALVASHDGLAAG